MARTKKTKKTKATELRAKKATIRSTGGVGFNFEDQAAAWLLVKMLRGEALPGINTTGDQLQMQTRSLGWDIDDLLASGAAAAASSGRAQVAVSCKSNVQVTSSGLPSDFVSAAWQQWRKTEPMHRVSDCLALVTRGRNATFDAIWSDIKTWCADSDATFTMAKINASEKHKKVFASVKETDASMGASVTDEDTVALIRHLHVIPLDFQLVPSETEQDSIARCREILSSGTLEDARKLWQALVQRAENARIAGGTIRLPELWAELRKDFALKNHPDFSASWKAVAGISADYKNGIETCLPTGFQITRVDHVRELSDLLPANTISVVYGSSGCGKSALVKSVLDTKFPDWQQIWFGPEQLESALSEMKRASIGLAHPLLDVLNSTTRIQNVLVIDAAERLTPESAAKARKFIAELAPKGATGEAAAWHVVIVGQTEAWADGRLQILSGAPPLPKYMEVEEVSAKEVGDALRSTQTLSWLTLHEDAVSALTNLRALGWVMQAESVFQAQSITGAISLTAVADRLWRFWTSGEARFQNLLMRLAEREAKFERSFALSELSIEDATAFGARPTQCPLRQNARNRIEFEHDLAADWARFQRLKEIAGDTAKWAALASNPLWNGALRMLGQFLLREPAGTRTAWDVAFESVEKSKEAPLAADILLDALCLDPLAETFLSEREDLLFKDHGARLNRLLRRFHHIATVAGIPPQLLQIDPSLQLYLEAQYRTPIIGRWIRIARFLAKHEKQAAALMSPVVAKICETWLTTTPKELAGVAFPFRKEFGELALATARAVQIAQGKGVIFLDESEKPIYMAAFAAAADLPDAVSEWALEMARRRPYAKDVAHEITAYRHQEAQKRAERLRTDEAYRKLEKQRRSGPTFIPSGRKLPPWPLGPKGRVEKDFHECCTHANSLAHLMAVRPQAAAEVLLATLIEDSPEESYSSSPRLDWELGLEFDNNGYPTAYWKSPYFQFLQINQTPALETLLKFVNFCAERWAHERGDPAHQPQTIINLPDGTERVFNGDARVFDWPQTNSNHTGQLHSALAALERWLCMEIDKGVDVTPVLNEVMTGSNSLSVLGVLINVGKYRPALFAGPLRCLLGNSDLYWCDDYRMKAAEYQFDAYSWARAGEVVFQMAKDWVLASYRRVPLRTIAGRLISSDANVAAFVTEAIQKWKVPVDEKSALEFRILVAELNQQNYTAASGAKSSEDTLQFQYPTELQSDIIAYQRAVAPKLQALYLPTECKKVLSLPRMLTGDEAGSLATALSSITSEEDEDTKRVARTAIASTLAAKAPAWLDQNPVVRDQVDEIIDEALAGVGETPETLRHSAIVGGREELKFVAHAVMQRWISTKGQNSELDSSVLRLMTSRDGQALATLMHVAYANRVSLGDRWERLLTLALLWSGLSLLAPRQDDTPGGGARWVRWLRWLRSRKLSGVAGAAKTIDFLGIAHRVERLEEQRSKRAPAGRQMARRSSRGRHSAGLDTHVLQQSFSWLLNDASSVEDRSLVNALWEFEVWRRYEDHDEDDRDHAPPSDLGYALLQKLAKLLIVTPQTDGAEIWKPVLSLGADAHYSIGHFISCWFIEASHQQDTTGIARHWRAMLEYALAAPNWTEGSHWYYGEQQLRQLLGFSSDAQISQVRGSQALILAMRDLYELWAGKHLIRDEDNVVGFCGFLASNAGAPLRLDGLRWLAAAIQTESRAARWHRDRTGNALVELLDVAVSQNGQELSINPAVREALVFLAAHLTARQVPAALALQERIRRIHQPVSRSG